MDALLQTDLPSRRVAVALSGGVDSSAAAARLVEEGLSPIAVTLRLHECRGPRAGRPSRAADGEARARDAAARLGIPHHTLDCAAYFEELVLRPAWDAYAAGRTPSPCLLCNERVKFGLLLEWAGRMGAPLLATGHYARVIRTPGGEARLLRGLDRAKDQSYFLAGLGQEQLASLLFPVGGLRKEDTRALARAHALPNADAPDSQDACLSAPGQSFSEMLRERFHAPERPGPIVDEEGRTLGEHRGVHLFTVGQSRGLGLRSHIRHWVVALDAAADRVVVSRDESRLLATRIRAGGAAWCAGRPPAFPLRCHAQVRHRHEAQACVLAPDGPDSLLVSFDSPVRAPAPGQAAVFYDGERVLGRAWISSPRD